jgi:hypothetical protein
MQFNVILWPTYMLKYIACFPKEPNRLAFQKDTDGLQCEAGSELSRKVQMSVSL